MKRILFIFAFAFAVILTACGQQKKYISYTVKQGETIKSIAKDNGMKSKDLLRLNPDVSKKPKVHTVIIIPNSNYSESNNDSEGRFHTVLKKETLFSIAKKYKVSVGAIKEINNLSGDYLSTGRVIQIPEETLEEREEIVAEEIVDPNAIMHLVVKDDTVYSLIRKYNVSEEELLGMNPFLKDGLKLGANIKVGEKKGEEEVEELNLFEDEITEKPLNVVLMLPYKLNSTNDLDFEFKRKNSLLNIATDFHSGALIAIDSLREQGMNVELKVVDTQNNSSKITSILKSGFKDIDVVVGPLFLKNAKQVSKSIGNVPVVAPIYSKSQATISTNNLVKVAPNKNLLEEKILNHIIETFEDGKMILIGDNSTASAYRVNQFISKLKDNSITDITVLKPMGGYIPKDRFIEVIDTVQKKNKVVLLSDDNIVTTDVVNNLGVMPLENRDIQLFGFNESANFKGVSNMHLVRLKYTYPSVEFSDVSNYNTENFINMYKREYYRRPSYFANKGFDVMYDTLLRLSNAKDFNEGALQGVSERIITRFDYSKRLFGSTENNGVFLIQYQENLELKAIN